MGSLCCKKRVVSPPAEVPPVPVARTYHVLITGPTSAELSSWALGYGWIWRGRREVEELLNRAELGSANLAVLLNSRSDRRRPLSQRECMCLLGLTELPPPLRDRVKTFEVDAQETHRDNSWQLALGWLVANIAMGSSSRPSHLATTTN
eukprot:GHVS01016792.1.p1 GENE.GHVS01016792.1~~GHVS01016792.1.p1  ORF type:complete len:149 (+),score=21.07 GHVS01016792.1:146-592(+)